MLHEVAAIDVDDRDVVLVLLKPFLVGWVIYVMLLVKELQRKVCDSASTLRVGLLTSVEYFSRVFFASSHSEQGS